MSYPLRPVADFAAQGQRLVTLASPARLPLAEPPDRLPQRARALTRRYEASWLTASGEVESSTRIAPATALFEEAFSALARGSLVATEAGPVAVEDLQPGMRALTAEGGSETITWIGSMTLYPGTTGEGESTLTRITAEAFGANRPMPDLVLGPRARLLLRDARCRAVAGSDAAYVPARAFVDGVSVIELRPAVPVATYHLVLERQSSLRVMGMEVESYHPGTGIEAMVEPRMLALFVAFFPHLARLADFGTLAHPRLTRFEVERLIE
ncbi:Hint domain-containing protein [Phaeovulum sp.]|uniref:Hint domain-containing protein n=1 Tax=Phaeovulum sp. TaxID=2934796 RepID=UPI0027315B15|nr:Hint domain-containing protein [Phaeovulum sp.]MDP1668258.1 Hint domain-containing protein [Phaeovulum sp.]MDZ4118106.1 Hint domain-containing protein [Phaeovulum sp.]